MNTINNSDMCFKSLDIIDKSRLIPRWTNIEHIYNNTDKFADDVLKLCISGKNIFYDYRNPVNSSLDSCGVILREGVEKLIKMTDDDIVTKFRKLVEICRANYRKTQNCQQCVEKISEGIDAGSAKYPYVLYDNVSQLRSAALNKDEIFQHVNVII